jgi:hypothetical protein
MSIQQKLNCSGQECLFLPSFAKDERIAQRIAAVKVARRQAEDDPFQQEDGCIETVASSQQKDAVRPAGRGAMRFKPARHGNQSVPRR